MSELRNIVDYLDKLEKRIHKLEDQSVNLSNASLNLGNRNLSQLSSKMQARLELMHTIRHRYPGLFVTVAKRKDGGGLLLTNKASNQNFTMKFYRSKNYSKNRLFAWFSIRSVDLFKSPNDFYAMSVSFEDKNHTFLFDHDSLVKLIKQKKSIQREKFGQEIDSSIIHFYIEQQQNEYMETRELNQSLDKDRGVIEGGINVTSAFNNFQIIEKTTAVSQNICDAPTMTSNPEIIKNIIDEILHQNFLIPLKSNDYYLKGNPILLIEFKPQEEIKIEKEFLDSLKRVILHIETHSNETFQMIEKLKNKVVNQIKHIPLNISVTMAQEKETIVKLICIGEYTID